jgi:hypothetical protein
MKIRGRSGTNKTRTGRLLKMQRRSEAREHEQYERYERRLPQQQGRSVTHAQVKKRIHQIFREMADDCIKRGLTDELLTLLYIRIGRKP